ncbi:hypothetical protein [Marinilabilia sp.]|uniref:hypothetical protein n=1 Tax=Marinilabilia sp. TaxID=2021252 RepID=UPI0025C3CECF|nr:hypothetical protein [Marinilabilia sp.]
MEKDNIVSTQSDKSSNVGRQIAFGLIGVSWTLTQNGDGFNMTLFPALSLLFLVIFFSIDLIQYYVTAINYRATINDFNIAKIYIENSPKLDRDEKNAKFAFIQENFDTKRYKIIRFSFLLFNIKFWVLPIPVVLLLIHIVQIIK